MGTADAVWQNRASYPAACSNGHGHISVQQLKLHLREDIWNSYFKFSFVRNPYDRFISTYFFLNRQQLVPGRDETPHMKEAIQYRPYNSMLLVAPQHRLIAERDGAIGVDYVARYEDIQSAYERICVKIGIPSKVLTQKNSSEHKPSRTYYDNELRKVVSEFYRTDFDFLGYDIQD